jgi:hypothetical protein
MHHRVLLIPLATLLLGLAGLFVSCDAETIEPSDARSLSIRTPAPSSDQASSGPGWRLVLIRSTTQVPEGVIVTSRDATSDLVAITVASSGAYGCGAPVFTGFERSGTTLVARIQRGPTSGTCAVVEDVTFSVVLDVAQIPKGVTGVTHSESCDDPGCLEHPAPLPSAAPSASASG